MTPSDRSDNGPVTLASLANDRVWVAWQLEDRKDGKEPSKMPYSPRGFRAKANAPRTWGTRAEAEAFLPKLPKPHGLAGVGLEFTSDENGRSLGGIDLDTCRDPQTGAIEPWALEVIERFNTYTEISPSQTGVKLYFTYTTDDLPALRAAMVGAMWSKEFKAGNDTHPPAIEVHLGNRYFCVTEQHFPGTPIELRHIPPMTLLWVLTTAGPNFAKAGKAKATGNGQDQSRSAKAFRKAVTMCRAGLSYDELIEALRADPETAEWVREKGEPNGERELYRLWDRAAPDRDGLPTIRVTAGKRHVAADAGLAALAAARVPFYVRDRTLVRVCRTKAKAADGTTVMIPVVVPVTAPILARALGQSACWEKLNRKDEPVRVDPPDDIVDQIAGMITEWPFPPLCGVISTPTMRPDGTLLLAEGYDPATGYVLFAPPTMPPIPDTPTKRDARDALATLNELLKEFPFANNASRSVALSMLMTPVLRGALAPAVPLHVITKPEAGTGASYLQDIASAIAIGDHCAVLSASSNEEETEKRLIGAALAQQPIIALDNLSNLLMGDFLCQVTERPVLQIRPLGKSPLIRIANSFTTFANGNNLTIGADVVRRTVQCALDAHLENPWDRQFTADPVATVLANRGKYVAACLSIARAYIVAGCPNRAPCLASFAGWSDTIRSALIWLGWSDPVETIATVQAEDPIRQQRAAVFSAWATELQLGIGYQTSELIKLANEYIPDQNGDLVRACPALWEALFAVAAPRSGPQPIISPERLGKWLNRHANTIVNQHQLACDRSDKARPRWKLAMVEAPPSPRCGQPTQDEANDEPWPMYDWGSG